MSNIKIKLRGNENEKERNFKERIWFIKYWADFIKTHNDKEWSKGQADFIDAQFDMARNFYDNLVKTDRGREIFERLKELRLKTSKSR